MGGIQDGQTTTIGIYTMAPPKHPTTTRHFHLDNYSFSGTAATRSSRRIACSARRRVRGSRYTSWAPITPGVATAEAPTPMPPGEEASVGEVGDASIDSAWRRKLCNRRNGGHWFVHRLLHWRLSCVTLARTKRPWPLRHDLRPWRHDLRPWRHESGPWRHESGPLRHDLGPWRHDLGPWRHESGPWRQRTGGWKRRGLEARNRRDRRGLGGTEV